MGLQLGLPETARSGRYTAARRPDTERSQNERPHRSYVIGSGQQQHENISPAGASVVHRRTGSVGCGTLPGKWLQHQLFCSHTHNHTRCTIDYCASTQD